MPCCYSPTAGQIYLSDLLSNSSMSKAKAFSAVGYSAYNQNYNHSFEEDNQSFGWDFVTLGFVSEEFEDLVYVG